MDTQLMVGLIIGGTATFTSLLIVGIQIVFYTKSFEEEYGDKVEKIKFRLKTTIDEFILKLIASTFKELLPIISKIKKGTEAINDKKLLEEIGHDLIKVHELDELLEATSKHNEWSEFMVDCKCIIRRIGISIISGGLIVLIFFIISVAIEDIGFLAFMGMALFFLAFILAGFISEYHNKLKKIDKTYQIVQAGLEV